MEGSRYKKDLLKRNVVLATDVGKGKNSSRGLKKFSTRGVKSGNFERGELTKFN